ncbi:MAG: hypothetical protein CM15mP18_2750 [Methanobacteriota archaeon]|nr:MAG: hypothetical protein CM15mP18_2750 [Euryarchaeota archaeon]
MGLTFLFFMALSFLYLYNGLRGTSWAFSLLSS